MTFERFFFVSVSQLNFIAFYVDFEQGKILSGKYVTLLCLFVCLFVCVCVLGVNVLLLRSVVVAVKGLVLCNALLYSFLYSSFIRRFLLALFVCLLLTSFSFVCLLLLRRLDQVDD